jgi:hypothetical protein
MVFYGACAAAGAVVPWYYNLSFMRESGEPLTPQRWFAEGFTTTGSDSGGAMREGAGTFGRVETCRTESPIPLSTQRRAVQAQAMR